MLRGGGVNGRVRGDVFVACGSPDQICHLLTSVVTELEWRLPVAYRQVALCDRRGREWRGRRSRTRKDFKFRLSSFRGGRR
jgi:hypothetical protein